MADGWADVLDTIVRALETGDIGTVFEQPGKVALLHDELGGDPTRWPALGAAANATVSKDAYFELLQAKAHYLMLPESIVKLLKDSSMVKIDEDTSEVAKASSTPIREPRSTIIHIPNGGVNLAQAGYELGRVPTVTGATTDILDSIYHEMTHAWLWLGDFLPPGDAEIQKLRVDGTVAYAPSTGDKGTEFDPWTAFTEAASYYVGDRIQRWRQALTSLDVLLRKPAEDH
jgi:hypothetical protein